MKKGKEANLGSRSKDGKASFVQSCCWKRRCLELGCDGQNGDLISKPVTLWLCDLGSLKQDHKPLEEGSRRARAKEEGAVAMEAEAQEARGREEMPSQRVQGPWSWRSWRSWGKGLSPLASRRNWPWLCPQELDLGLLIPRICERINLCCFKPLHRWSCVKHQ